MQSLVNYSKNLSFNSGVGTMHCSFYQTIYIDSGQSGCRQRHGGILEKSKALVSISSTRGAYCIDAMPHPIWNTVSLCQRSGKILNESGERCHFFRVCWPKEDCNVAKKIFFIFILPDHKIDHCIAVVANSIEQNDRFLAIHLAKLRLQFFIALTFIPGFDFKIT